MANSALIHYPDRLYNLSHCGLAQSGLRVRSMPIAIDPANCCLTLSAAFHDPRALHVVIERGIASNNEHVSP